MLYSSIFFWIYLLFGAACFAWPRIYRIVFDTGPVKAMQSFFDRLGIMYLIVGLVVITVVHLNEKQLINL